MRLPADATLIVVHGAGPHDAGAPGEANVAGLLAAWRAEALPVVHLGAGAQVRPSAAPIGSETVIARDATPGGALAEALDAIGATTLVLCGDATEIPKTVREAVSLGCHAFVVADAAWNGAAPVAIEDGKVVDCLAALAAASVAKARQRRSAARRR